MSFRSARIGSVYVLRWQEPTKQDLVLILDEIAQAHKDCGEKVVYLGIVGEESPPPDDDVRKAMTSTFNDLQEHCSTSHLVIEGRGFRNVMLRSIATGVFLVSGNRTTHMHDTVASALDKMALPAAQKEELLRKGRELGLFDPAPPAS